MDGPLVTGLHHLTAICRDAQENVDFYAGVLGLRLVKKTVNFDDPTAYHLYYGDATGSPGTLLTFFPYPNGRNGVAGSGQVTEVTLQIPPGSTGAWTSRLSIAGVPCEASEDTIELADPDGIAIRLRETEEGAIPRMAGVSLQVSRAERTVALLTGLMGYSEVASEGRRRFVPAIEGYGEVEIEERPGDRFGHGGPGTVHHVAFRTPSSETQERVREELLEHQFHVSPIMERNYFRSIYFREPGGVLFEIATDPPGMLIDETPETLGETLRLPDQYESMRSEIERLLPRLTVPEPVR